MGHPATVVPTSKSAIAVLECRRKKFPTFLIDSIAEINRARARGAVMAITKALVDAYGGSISLVVPDDGGACFIVELPGSLAPQNHLER